VTRPLRRKHAGGPFVESDFGFDFRAEARDFGFAIYDFGSQVWTRVGISGLAQGDEFGVSQDLARSPLSELYLGLDFRTQPNIVGHFFGSDAFAPMAGFGCREVGEGPFGGGQGLQKFQECEAVGGVEALVDFAGE